MRAFVVCDCDWNNNGDEFGIVGDFVFVGMYKDSDHGLGRNPEVERLIKVVI